VTGQKVTGQIVPVVGSHGEDGRRAGWQSQWIQNCSEGIAKPMVSIVEPSPLRAWI